MLKTLLLIVFGATAWGYAQLGEEMKCANGECTETVSEGRAKLAYQPRDKKFLNLKKGDVVLVKGKKAGMKTDLWGGEEFLKRVFPEKEDVSIISNADQEIKIQKQAKDKKENDDNQAEQTSVKENELDLNKEDQPKDREENDDNQAEQTSVKENELDLNKEDQPKDREENDDNQAEQTSVKENELDLNKEDQPKDREENDDNDQFKQTSSVEENEPDLNKEDTKSDVQNVDSDKHDSDIEKPKSEESAGAIISQDNGGSDEKENKSTDQTENKNETKDFRGGEDQTENKSLKDSTLSETSNEDIVNESNKSSNSDKMAANSLLKPADNDKESVVDANEDAKKSFSKDIASAEDAEQQESKETKPAEEEREKVLSTEVSSEAVKPKKDAASSENINDKESAPGEELLTKSSQNSSENTSISSASNSSSVADGQEQALTAETDKLKATSQDENASVFPDQGTNSNNLPLEATTKGKTSDLKNNISVEVSENKSTPGDDSSKPNSTKNTENSLGQKNITMDNDEEEPSRTKQDSPLINKEEIKEESPDASSSNKSPNDDSSLIPQEVGKTNEKLLDSKNQDTTSDLSSNQQKDLANQNEKNLPLGDYGEMQDSDETPLAKEKETSYASQATSASSEKSSLTVTANEKENLNKLNIISETDVGNNKYPFNDDISTDDVNETTTEQMNIVDLEEDVVDPTTSNANARKEVDPSNDILQNNPENSQSITRSRKTFGNDDIEDKLDMIHSTDSLDSTTVRDTQGEDENKNHEDIVNVVEKLDESTKDAALENSERSRNDANNILNADQVVTDSVNNLNENENQVIDDEIQLESNAVDTKVDSDTLPDITEHDVVSDVSQDYSADKSSSIVNEKTIEINSTELDQSKDDTTSQTTSQNDPKDVEVSSNETSVNKNVEGIVNEIQSTETINSTTLTDTEVKDENNSPDKNIDKKIVDSTNVSDDVLFEGSEDNTFSADQVVTDSVNNLSQSKNEIDSSTVVETEERKVDEINHEVTEAADEHDNAPDFSQASLSSIVENPINEDELQQKFLGDGSSTTENVETIENTNTELDQLTDIAALTKLVDQEETHSDAPQDDIPDGLDSNTDSTKTTINEDDDSAVYSTELTKLVTMTDTVVEHENNSTDDGVHVVKKSVESSLENAEDSKDISNDNTLKPDQIVTGSVNNPNQNENLVLDDENRMELSAVNDIEDKSVETSMRDESSMTVMKNTIDNSKTEPDSVASTILDDQNNTNSDAPQATSISSPENPESSSDETTVFKTTKDVDSTTQSMESANSAALIDTEIKSENVAENSDESTLVSDDAALENVERSKDISADTPLNSNHITIDIVNNHQNEDQALNDENSLESSIVDDTEDKIEDRNTHENTDAIDKYNDAPDFSQAPSSRILQNPVNEDGLEQNSLKDGSSTSVNEEKNEDSNIEVDQLTDVAPSTTSVDENQSSSNISDNTYQDNHKDLESKTNFDETTVTEDNVNVVQSTVTDTEVEDNRSSIDDSSNVIKNSDESTLVSGDFVLENSEKSKDISTDVPLNSDHTVTDTVNDLNQNENQAINDVNPSESSTVDETEDKNRNTHENTDAPDFSQASLSHISENPVNEDGLDQDSLKDGSSTNVNEETIEKNNIEVDQSTDVTESTVTVDEKKTSLDAQSKSQNNRQDLESETGSANAKINDNIEDDANTIQSALTDTEVENKDKSHDKSVDVVKIADEFTLENVNESKDISADNKLNGGQVVTDTVSNPNQNENLALDNEIHIQPSTVDDAEVANESADASDEHEEVSVMSQASLPILENPVDDDGLQNFSKDFSSASINEEAIKDDNTKRDQSTNTPPSTTLDDQNKASSDVSQDSHKNQEGNIAIDGIAVNQNTDNIVNAIQSTESMNLALTDTEIKDENKSNETTNTLSDAELKDAEALKDATTDDALNADQVAMNSVNDPNETENQPLNDEIHMMTNTVDDNEDKGSDRNRHESSLAGDRNDEASDMSQASSPQNSENPVSDAVSNENGEKQMPPDTDSHINSHAVNDIETKASEKMDLKKTTEFLIASKYPSDTVNQTDLINLNSVQNESFVISDKKESNSAMSASSVVFFELLKELNSLTKTDQEAANRVFGDVSHLRNQISGLVKQIQVLNISVDFPSYRSINRKTKSLKQRFEEVEKLISKYEQGNLRQSFINFESSVDINKQVAAVEKQLNQRKELHFFLSDIVDKAVHELQDDLAEVEEVIHSISYTTSLQDLVKSLQSKVEEQKKVDDIALLATEREAKIMQEKLQELRSHLQDSDFENKDFINSLQNEATMLKDRLIALESQVDEKKKIEESCRVSSEQKGEEWQRKISLLEAELERRKNNEAVLYEVQYEAGSLKEKLKQMNAKVESVRNKRNLKLSNRFSKLEKELVLRRNNESEVLQKTMLETQKLNDKITELENIIKSQNQDDSQEMSEVSSLKKQLDNLENLLASRKSSDKDLIESSLHRENAMQKRIEILENELKDMGSKEKEIQDAIEKSHELMSRISSLEYHVAEEQSLLKANIHKEELVNVLKQQIKSNEDTFKEILEQAVSKQTCSVINENSSNNNERKLIENKVQVASDITETDCSIELEERLRCGMLDIPQALCVALNCCWSIQADMNVPNCYYSLSQQQSIEDANQKKALVSDQAPPSPSESYDNVHEGVVVDWDESVGEKKKPKNNWDEQLGSQEDSNPPETDVKDLELKQATDHAADKSDQEETDSDNEKMNQQAETISLDDDNVVTERSGQNLDEESNTPTAPVVEPELSDVRSEKISDVEPGVAEAAPTTPASNIDEGAQYHQQSSEATLDTETKCPPGDQDCVLDSLEEQSVKINYNEVEVESVLMQALYLAASFPNEFIFVMTPIALKWNALLPKEYQDDLFGYSWPTICQTCMIGLFVLWIFVWRFNAGRQRNKTKKYEAEIERLRDLATQYAKETVDEENKKFALTKKLRLLEEENNNQSSSLEASVSKNEELMQQANDFKIESERKSQDLDAINQKVKDLEKEKTKIVKNLKDKEKELNKHHSSSTEAIEKLDVTIQSLNSTIDSLRNKLEESEKEKEKFQKKSNEFEKNLTHSEKTFKKKEKLVKEYEVKTCNLKEEIEKLQKEIENLNAEKTFANNEIDSVKDCFLHLQSVQDALLKEGDEELDADELALKQKERVLDLIDTLKLHAKTIKVEAERDKLGMELQKEKEQRLKVEITRDELQFEVKNQKSLVAEVHQEMEMERSKLQSLENYYSKKESDVHQSLAQKHEEARTLNLQYEESKKSIEHLTEEVKKYREMAFRGQKEYEENNRRLKSDMQEYEKKSHSSWLSLKEAERNLDGANRQIADLQKEVGFLKDEKRRFESRPPPPPFIRPRPRYEPHSPFPFSPGSRPEPGRSPSTSMHSGYRTPDRPSSQADMRPSDPLEVGDGKLTTNDTSGGRLDRAAFSPPPHDRPPMDDGLRNMPPRGPPMIDPFYGPPSRGLPMGERPFGPHRGSPFAPRPGPFTPHGMNRGPPPRAYDGPMSHPPPTNRPGSRPDASGNSPYTDRRMHPGNDSSVPAMMPLHGNRSLSRNQNEYDLHPVRDSV